MIVYPKIRAFLTVAETLNFTQAAAILYTSQSALSKMIASLESECGYQLFVRSNRAIVLTHEGKLLYDKLKGADKAIHDAIVEVGSIHRGESGLLNIAIAAAEPLMACVSKKFWNFSHDNPNIKLEFSRYSYGDMAKIPFTENNDAYIFMTYDNIYSLPEIVIAERSPVLCAASWNKIFDDGMPCIESFRNAEFVALHQTTSYGFLKYMTNVLSSYGLSAKITKHLPNISEERLNVMVNDYARFSFSDSVKSEGEIVVPLPDAPKAELVVAWNPSNQNPALEKLVNYLRGN